MRIKYFALGLIMLVFILFGSGIAVADSALPPFSVDKNNYQIDDTVNLSINIDPANYNAYYLVISAFNNSYTYKGDFNPVMFFYPTEEGIYTIALVEKSTGAIFYSLSLNVSANNRTIPPKNFIYQNLSSPGNAYAKPNQGSSLISQGSKQNETIPAMNTASNLSSLISTDKKTYLVGEAVSVYLDLSNAGQVSLYHYFNGVSERYMGDLGFIRFIPEGIGTHSLILQDSNNNVVSEYDFEVSSSTSEKPIEILNSLGSAQAAEMNVLDEKGGVGSFDIPLNKKSLKKIRLNNLQFRKDNTSLNLRIGVDDISPEKFNTLHIKQKRVVKAFAIDSGSLNFTNGTATGVAVGNELWKCRQWDFMFQQCLGVWEKVMDLTPGMEYDIELSPGDPGYAETGVASINTKKPIYYPGETAEIIMVVLDTEGHLVSNADVSLIVTAPDNTSTVLTTGNGKIKETDKGIYETTYSNTIWGGTYYLEIRAIGNDVNSTMFSFFLVKPYYEFDILRETPVTTDPWKGDLISSIRIISYTDSATFNFTEVLPASFEIADSGGALIATANNKTYLTWVNLNNNSLVSYSARPPLITPELYEFGPSFVSYNTGIFYEARPWYLAVDPQSEGELPNGDGAYTTWTIAGSAPAGTRWQSVDDPIGAPDNGVTYIASPNNANRNSFSFSDLSYSSVTVQWIDVTVRARRSAGTGGSATLQIFYREGGSDYNNANTQGLTTAYVTYSLAGWNYTTNPATGQPWNLTTVNNMEWGVLRSAATSGRLAWVTQMYVTVGYSLIPNITSLNYPNNSANLSSSLIQFNFTVADDEDPIANCTLFGNFSGSWAPNKTITDVANNTLTNISLSLPDGNYIWNIQCNDSFEGSSFYASNYSFRLDTTYPAVDYSSGTEGNDTFFNRSWVFVNVSAYDINEANITFSLFNLSGLVSNVTLAAGSRSYNFTGLNYNMQYWYNVTVCDQFGWCNTTETRIITLDNSPPAVDYSSGTEDNDTFFNRSWVYVNVSAYDISEANVTMSLFDLFGLVSNVTLAAGSRSHNFTDLNPDMQYWYNVTVTDKVNNKNTTRTYKITLDNTYPTIDYSTGTADNDTYYNRNWIYVNVTANDTNEANITFSLYDTTGEVNITTRGAGNRSINFTNLNLNWQYWYNVTTTDKAGLASSTLTRKITFDSFAPAIALEAPGNDSFVNNGLVQFYYTPSDTSPLQTCVLYGNFSGAFGPNVTNSSSASGELNSFAPISLADGRYLWNVWCNDSAGNYNFSNSNYTLKVDTQSPIISGWKINGTSFAIYDHVCLNVSVGDSFSGVETVYAEIENPTSVILNFTMLDDGTGCDAVSGDNIYSYSYYIQFPGNYNWLNVHAKDYSNNWQVNATNLNWAVSSSGSMTALMISPSADIKINESGYNYEYQQTCNVSCDAGGINCEDVTLFAQYRPEAIFLKINTTTTDLVNDENNFSCGTLTAGGASCSHTFNITSGNDSGNHTWQVRCFASSSNVGSFVSQPVNLTINDHPYANFTYPLNNDWLSGVEMLNASFSFDSDGTIVSYLFEYDNNTAFSSPGTICNSASSNCTWNTSQQDQCDNNTLACYLRLTVTDNDGLSNSTYMTVGFNTQGPATAFDFPRNFENITGNTFTVNATATDVTGVDTVTFEYRPNSSAAWIFACSDNRGPVYNCDWDLTGLQDGITYEMRAYANDTLGTIGDYDVHTNISIDNNNPALSLVFPPDDYIDTDGNLVFVYQVTDSSRINNCTLIINDLVNQTNTTIEKDINQYFYLYGQQDGSQLNWSINCTDSFNFINASETRSITVSLTSSMLVNVSTSQENYYEGESVPVTTNVTDIFGGGLEANISTDIVRVYNNSEQVAPWWNASWKQRKPIYVSTSSTQDTANVTVVVNVTDLGGNITSCVNEIRVASLYGVESPVNIITGDDSTYCYIAFKANVSANANNENNYFVYYNNSAATDPGYATFGNYQYNITTIDAADSWVNAGSGNQNNGAGTTMDVRGRATERRTYIRFNFTLMPLEVTGVTQATLCMYMSTDGTTHNVSVHHVYNQEWTETGITHNNQPCGTAFNNAANCNLTAENTQLTSGVGWECWNVTSMTGVEVVQNGRKNLSIALKNFTEAGTTASSDVFNSKENANASSIPYLSIAAYGRASPNITASSVGSPQQWITSNSSQTDYSGIWIWNWSTIGYAAGNYSSTSLAIKIGYNNNYNFSFFDILDDSTAPVVKQISPENNNYTVLENVTFYYNVSDPTSSIANCSLIIDGSIVNTTDNPVRNITLNFTYTLGEGYHNWSVNCTDINDNKNSSGLRNITLDISGPVSTLYRPQNDSVINGISSGYIYKLNATITDSGIGGISVVIFMYRVNSTDSWKFACNDSSGTPPYECNWNLTGLRNGRDYEVRVYANDTLGNVGANDTHINITILAQPMNITSIVVDDSVYIPINQIDLQAGTTHMVYCNITVSDSEVYTDILGVNATLYSITTTYGAADNNRTHYTNSSCTFLTGGGQSADYQCAFNIWHFAINGTWNCTGFTWNDYLATNATDNTTINQLFALNISTSTIDYSNLQPNETSQNVTVNISNVGNMPMNISVYGFGGDNEVTGAGLSMICQINNISVSFERFSTNTTANYSTKRQLSATLQDLRLTIPAKTSPEEIRVNSTYWQFMVPPQAQSLGQCNGSVVFVAQAP